LAHLALNRISALILGNLFFVRVIHSKHDFLVFTRSSLIVWVKQDLLNQFEITQCRSVICKCRLPRFAAFKYDVTKTKFASIPTGKVPGFYAVSFVRVWLTSISFSISHKEKNCIVTLISFKTSKRQFEKPLRLKILCQLKNA